MILGGLLLAVLGVGGLFIDKVITTIPHEVIPYVHGGAIAFIAVGALIFAIGATEEYGAGFWALAVVGFGASELFGHWLSPQLRPWVLWTTLAIIVLGALIGVGVGLLVLDEEFGTEASGGVAATVGLIAVLVGAFLDLGPGWDPSLDGVGVSLLAGGVTAVLADGMRYSGQAQPIEPIFPALLAGLAGAAAVVVVAGPAAWVTALVWLMGAAAAAAVLGLAFAALLWWRHPVQTKLDLGQYLPLGIVAAGVGIYAVVLALCGWLLWLFIPLAVAGSGSAYFAGRRVWWDWVAAIGEIPPVRRLSDHLLDLSARTDPVYRLLPREW
ncbi:hypothetical protein [Actinokineospora enzanensis]|uniref:hypothetical protein n=1 Tax=Actinokineospora enzanensis TaxID=155975 RepID=UPI00047544F7|nr:hypothetical protein [Actinokineospora enzanensis]